MTQFLRTSVLFAASALFAIGAAFAQTEPGQHKGEADAPITIIEYLSPTCSHCRDFHRDVGPTIANYVEDGKVRIVVREFLRNDIDVAVAAMARCSDSQYHFDVMDAAFKRQDDIIAASKNGTVKKTLVEIGRPFGIDNEEAFDACYSDIGIRTDLQEISKLAQDAELTGVPSIIVNGTLLPNDETLETGEAFAAYLDTQLAKTVEAAN